MPRPRPPAPPVKLPLFDYQAWAKRLVETVREGRPLEEAVASVEAYAREVRDLECAQEAARIVGFDTERIRKTAPFRRT